MFELVIILLSISKIFCGCCDCCNCCLRVEVNRSKTNMSDNNKLNRELNLEKIDFSKLPRQSNDKHFSEEPGIEKYPEMNDINISMFNTLAKKKLYFSDEDRRAPEFKRFKFLKNCFPNEDNRCWLISEIMLFGNSPFQEIILNNDVSDNIYLETLKKLFIKMREENDKKGYLNCDELIKLIDSKIGRNGRFCSPFHYYENTFYTRRRERGELIFENIFFQLTCTTELCNKFDINKLRDLCPIIYSVQISSGYHIDLEKIVNTLEFEINNLICRNPPILNRPEQGIERKSFHPKVMYFYDDEQTEKEFLELIHKGNLRRKIFENEKELYVAFEKKYYEVKNNFEFYCNGIILSSFSYHFFAICHNQQDGNWYNFNSLDGKNGDICNDLVTELIKKKEIKIGSHAYIPDLFLITVKKKH